MKRFQKAELLLNFAVFSKGLDAKDKIKLALFASRTKPNTYIVLKINPASLGEKYDFEKRLKANKIPYLVSRPKGYEEIASIQRNKVRWHQAGIWFGYDLFRSREDMSAFRRYKRLIAQHRPERAHILGGRIYGYPSCCVKAYIKETPQWIAKHFSYYDYYKRFHDFARAFPFVLHQPCSLGCVATKRLNAMYKQTIREVVPEVYQSYTKKRFYDGQLIVDTESDIIVEGKSIWEKKDGHDYSLISKDLFEGKHWLFEYLTRKAYERGSILESSVIVRCGYADIKIKAIAGILKGLRHERRFELIGRPF